MKFIFISNDNSGFTEYNLRTIYIVLISVLLVSLVTLPSVYFFLKYDALFVQSQEDQLKSDKLIEEMNAKVLESSGKISQIKEKLDTLHVKDDKIRSVIGLPEIPDDIRKMGVGGGANDLDDGSYDIDSEKINNFVSIVDSLFRVSALQALSYERINDYVEVNIDKINRIPFMYPVDVSECKFTSGFGMRNHPIRNRKIMHEGHDFAPLENYWNTKVFATADGVVKKSGSHPTYGNYVEIDHGDGVVTAYAHLRVIGWRVSKNKKVKRGQFLGYMGDSGLSKGVHLHYEIKKHGRAVNPSEYYYSNNIF
tara:strand:- start:1382 stop:2308 length:927 start_codon:yes stop_codon:yes gene_type:complete